MHIIDEYRLERMKAAVRTLLKAVGEDVEREGLIDTPKRVVKALIDASSGYHQTPASVLGDALFNEPIVRDAGPSIVCVRDIEFASTSSDTLLPFHGRCHIGYVPSNGVVLGLSKFSRLTKMLAKRLQTQSQLGAQIAASLQHHLGCHGVAVVIEAKHLCMGAAALPGQQTTVSVCGCFAEPCTSHLEELLAMLGLEAAAASTHSLTKEELHASVEAAMGRSSSGLVSGPATPDLSGSEQGSDKSCGESCDEACEGSSLTCSTASEWDDGGCCAGGCSRASPEPWQAASSQGAAPAKEQAGQQGEPAAQAEGAPASIERAMRVLLRGMLNGRDPDDLGLGSAAASYASSLLASTAGYSAPVPSVSQCAARHSSGSCCSCAGGGATSVQQPGTPGRAAAEPQAAAPSIRRCAGGIASARFAFTSQCEHHMLPFYGTVDVAWREDAAASPPSGSDDAVVEALSALVGAYTRRLQVQERITQQVAEGVAQLLGCSSDSSAGGGVLVLVDAAHMCMVARGVENHAGRTTTTATRGQASTDQALRARLLQACRSRSYA